MSVVPTEQRLTERALLFAKWDRSPEAILIEKHEKIVYTNQRYARYFGYQSSDLIGRHVSMVISPADEKRMLNYGRKRIIGQHVPSAYEFHGRQKDGSPIRLAARVSAAPELSLITTVVSRSPRGDEEGFEGFYSENAGRVYAILLRIVRDEHAAQDVLQESFMQAWRQRSSYAAERGTPAAWLNVIARSRALDHLRAQRSSGPPGDAGMQTTPDPRGEQNVSSGIESSQLRRMLERLSSPQRTAIELAYLEGYSQTEIAEKLALPLGTVKTRILLGMRSLREHLRQHERPHRYSES